MNKDKSIVITGASGFIGSGVVRYLNDLGMDNLILVDLQEPRFLNKRWKSFLHKDALFDWLSGREETIGAFIHLGACSDTLEQNRAFLDENNTQFSIRLAEYALKHGHRFIYASSAATYGNGSRGFSDNHDFLEELEPLNLYGLSKHLFDLWAKKEGVLNQVVGLKYFNVFGPNEGHKGRMASMVYKMVPHVQAHGVVRLYQSSEPHLYVDGGQQRDFVYIKQAVVDTCRFLNSQVSGIFNIGRGEPITWNRLATAIFTALDLAPQIEYIPMPQDLIGQYQNFTCADMSKYHSYFKDRTIPLIEDEVKDYICNHLLKDAPW